MNIIKYKIDDFKRISCMDDFYKSLGIFNEIGKTIIEVGQIHMEQENCERLQEYIFESLCKNKKYRVYKEDKLKCFAAMDWLQFSPVSDKNMPKDEIWIDELSEDEIAKKIVENAPIIESQIRQKKVGE